MHLNINWYGLSILLYVKFAIIDLAPKYSKNPINNEFAINKIPFAVVVPNILSKYLSDKIFLFTKTKSSKTSYKLSSMEENKFPKIVFIWK